MTKTDNKLTLVMVKFSMKGCKYLKMNKIESLSEKPCDFFIFL